MQETLLMPQSLSTQPTPYHCVTVLTGEESFYSASKSWALDPDTGAPTPTGDYHLGKYFCWRTEPVVPGAELISLYELITRLSDEPRSFIIYGQPEPWLPSGEKAQRKREFFHEPAAVQRLLVDVDGWHTDIQWWKGPAELRTALHTLLHGYGLGYLAGADCLVSLSQSAWPGGPLKCHLYYWLEEPVALPSLREWARVVNDRVGSKVLDPVVYGHVHIDYTASRVCQGFTDPFQGRRLTLLSGAGTEDGIIGGVRVVDGLQEELDAAGVGGAGRAGGAGARGAGGLGSDGIDVGVGDAWAVLARSGQGGDINEYGYRAAARLVRDLGKDAVLRDVNRLAERMHTEAWSVIAVNSEGTRGDAKDAATYTVGRYRQYLQSACDASIGDAVDRHVGTVRAALTGASARELLSGPVIDAAARLKTGWPGLFQDLRREVKASRLLVMTTFDQAVEGQVKSLARSARLSEAAVDEALDRLEMVDDVVAGRIVDGEGNVDEVEFYRAVAGTFDVVQGSSQAVFLDLGATDGMDEDGYKVLPLSSLPSAIVVRAMDLAQSLGISRGQLFTGARSQVGGMIDQYISEQRGGDGQGWVASRIHGLREVSSRWYRVPATGVLWANLGAYRCVRVDWAGVGGVEDGVSGGYKVMTWQEALKGYPDAPIWTSNIDVEVSAEDLEAGRSLDWVDEMFRLIRVDTVEERVMVLAWTLSAVLNWPIRYILQLYGLPGSGKSTTGDILCEMVNPTMAPDKRYTLDMKSRDRRALADLRKDPALNLSGVDALVIDNIDRLTRSSQNWLCQLSTGIGVTREIKYTHIKLRENLQTAVVLTGISTHDTQADYGERAFDVEIVKRRDGIGYPGDYWRMIRGRVIGGLIMLAGRISRDLRNGDIAETSRDNLLQSVSNTVIGRPAAGGLGRSLGVGLASAERRVIQSPFSSCFLVWLQHDMDNWGTGGKLACNWVAMKDVFRAYDKWVMANAGKVFKLSLPLNGEDDFRVKYIKDGVDFTSSNNVISFGRAFWQRVGDMSAVLKNLHVHTREPFLKKRTNRGIVICIDIFDEYDQFFI